MRGGAPQNISELVVAAFAMRDGVNCLNRRCSCCREAAARGARAQPRQQRQGDAAHEDGHQQQGGEVPAQQTLPPLVAMVLVGDAARVVIVTRFCLNC